MSAYAATSRKSPFVMGDLMTMTLRKCLFAVGLSILLSAGAYYATPSCGDADAATTQSSSDARNGITRTKTADGGLLVQSAKPPRTRLDPHGLPDFAYGDWYIDNIGSEPAVITPFIEKDAYGSDVQDPVLESLLTRDRDTFEWQPFIY